MVMAALPPLTHYRFTVDEYHRMAEAGILTEDDRVELLDGEIVAMSPIGSSHSGCINALTELLTHGLIRRASISVQNPVRLDRYWEPQPDLAVLRPRSDHYRSALPGPADVLLLIEVADSTVEFDRGIKAPLYARHGIPELWIVNLPADRIEVYRDPTPDGYREVRTAARGDVVTLARFPELEVRADEILG